MHWGNRVTNDTLRRSRSRNAARPTPAADPFHELLAAMQDVNAGDFSVQLPLHWDGIVGKLAESFNQIVAANRHMCHELGRVGEKVGRQGQTRQRMAPANGKGAWSVMELSVNSLIDDLVRPVETMTEAMAGVAKGDLTRSVPLEADGRPLQGEFLRSANIVNRMIEQMGEFSSEVTRVALEVGTAGLLGGQAKAKGVSGVWKDLTDSVNQMASNLTAQVRNISEVTIAVANGDLSRKITVDVRGEILQLKEAINTMVDQLRGFASEVTRVAREVGTEGKLGGQAIVPGVAGTWKDLTDSVNAMASNLTSQVRNIAEVTIAVANGDLSRKITVDVRGEILQLKETINTMVDQLNGFAAEVTRVAREVGTEGKLGGQAEVPDVAGTWKDLTDHVNSMASNLTLQVRNIAEVTTAVAKGDLSRKITADVRGEILELKDTINTMVDQLNGFAAEVTRVAREVGTEGKLGGQAQVPGVAGTWKDLTDNVNSMATNLTTQVRGIAKVVTAVANGDLHKKLTLEAKGEIAELADTINGMTGTLAIFADQVTTVAREVGVEGRLGGQANVPGTAGIWKDLTANVNQLAANLTTQVRAIAEVATAVTQGDLTRSIQVDVRGELADLKDNMNSMIGTLRATTDSNREQDWLKTNLAKFSGMMQGQRDLITLGHMLLSELAPLVHAQQGLMYVAEADGEVPGNRHLRQLAGYADANSSPAARTVRFGEGLIGQCAAQAQLIVIDDVPPGSMQIESGLLSAIPRSVIVLPVLFEDQVKAVIELASLSEFTESQRAFLEQLSRSIGIVLNTIEATMRTEHLLSQSQQLAGELQSQQKELQQTNEDIALKAALLAEQKAEVEHKNQQIEHARRELEDRAAELALTSRYKSEFLANMSHELRTPLNSILILGQQLAENPDTNLSERQVEYAKTIHAAGTDLLHLISDILDLSKIESGTVTVDSEEIAFAHLRENIERGFRHEAERRALQFSVDFEPELGRALSTDPKRLQQILKNLLSNAFKFTEHGSVRLSARATKSGWNTGHTILDQAPTVVAFEVSDTGIGISPEKQKIVFEAFQQADAGTSRKYGGTGLGLAISREIAGLLGGELRLRSAPGKGSTFTLYLPLNYVGAEDEYELPGVDGMLHHYAHVSAVDVSLPVLQDVADDRAELLPGEPSLLVIEDDPRYAKVLRDQARAHGFKVLLANRGSEALRLVREYKPSAISLDIFLPDMLGWTVLARLKQDSATRHIPVQIITVEEERHQGIERGAFAYLAKPASTETIDAALQRIKQYSLPRVKRLLIVEDDASERMSIEELIRHDDIAIDTVGSGEEALAALRSGSYDCAVLDLRLPDMSGFELLDRIQDEPGLRELPIVVFTGKDLSADEEQRLKKAAKSVVIKGVESPERLLDETALFLHRVIAELPPAKRRMVQRLHESDEALRDKRVLVVDDDVRNIFALSSVLERHGMAVVTAGNGQEAIEKIAADRDIALVLMDIMMPGMDGYDTMRAIRGDPDSRALPIVALTAKAMKGDREKCLEAGASDYLAKPVVTDQLLGVLRQWLHR